MSNLKTNGLKYSKNGKNILQEFSNILSYINIDRKEKHFHGKCAEVFIENGHYFINCYFCGNNLRNMESLIPHVYQEHFKLNVPYNWEKQQEEYEINKNIEKDTEKIVSKSKDKLDSNNLISIEDNGTIDLETNITNEVIDDVCNNIVNKANNESEYLNISNISIQSRIIDGEYSCSFCAQSFKKSEELEKHVITHSPTSVKNEIITNHKNYNKNDFYDTNDINDFSTKNIKAKRHEDGSYHCELCDRKYVHHYSYRAHFLQTHRPELNPYKCPDCPMTFTMSNRFKNHRRTHTGERPYKCPHCPRAFALNINLTRHIDIHLGKKPYICQYCGKTFTQLNSRKSHERNIHTKERPHQCEHCGKSFAYLFSLKEHWKRHTNNRPYQCDICFKSFYDNTALNVHINTHTGEKSFDCDLCTKKFRAINALKAHKKLHLDTKQYQCKMCDKAFAQFAGLHGHMKVYHKTMKIKLNDT